MKGSWERGDGGYWVLRDVKEDKENDKKVGDTRVESDDPVIPKLKEVRKTGVTKEDIERSNRKRFVRIDGGLDTYSVTQSSNIETVRGVGIRLQTDDRGHYRVL